MLLSLDLILSRYHALQSRIFLCEVTFQWIDLFLDVSDFLQDHAEFFLFLQIYFIMLWFMLVLGKYGLFPFLF